MSDKPEKIFVASVHPGRDKFENPFFNLGFNDEDLQKLKANQNEKGYANAYLQKSKEGKWYAHILPPKAGSSKAAPAAEAAPVAAPGADFEF